MGARGDGNRRTSRDHINYRLTRILRRVLETWGDLFSLRLLRKTICKRCGEKLASNNNNNNNNIFCIEDLVDGATKSVEEYIKRGKSD